MARFVRRDLRNVAFDKDYEPLSHALVFTITACGYRVRCALEEDDSGNIRMDKLDRMIRESPRSIHDLSRTELSEYTLPRFNILFELGVCIGAKRFGRGRNSVAERYRLPAYLSDLGGNDPSAHERNAAKLIKVVRYFLHVTPARKMLPGAAKLKKACDRFDGILPMISEGIEFTTDEIDGFTSCRPFLWCVVEFLQRYEQPVRAAKRN